jgi:2-(1,2-epoxy-1,2-dihydrophenyl)acetyl-CoA isomerase
MSVVTIETPQAGIARLAINRPDKRNAINPETREALIEGIGGLLADDDVHCIILGSTDGHFCSGGDITSMDKLDVRAARVRMQQNHRLVRLLLEAEKPVIAAIEGFAVGAGAGLAMLADTIVLAESGTIGFPFFRVGLTPDYGILYTLPRRVGPGRARQILLYARMVKAEEACGIGLADVFTPDGDAEAVALEVAGELTVMPPHAFALAKRHLTMAAGSLEATLEMEAMAQALCFNGPEFAEGRAAFAEKRKPEFRRAKS